MSSVRNTLIALIDRALGDDPKAALVAATQLDEEVEWLRTRAVARARAEGFDWGRIGRLLGVTRQSARERYRVIVPRLPPHQRADHRSPLEQQALDTERTLRDIRNGTWRRDQDGGEGGDVVPW